MILMIINLEGTSKLHKQFKSYLEFTNVFFLFCWIDPQSQDVPSEGVSRERSVAVAVAVGVSDRWQVTCDTRNIIHDT